MENRQRRQAIKLYQEKKRRQKELAKTVLIIIMLLYIAFDFINSIKANQVPQVKVQEEYIVSNGETLWSIADSLELEEDIRQTIYRIEQENKCNSNLKIGQKLILTYYK